MSAVVSGRNARLKAVRLYLHDAVCHSVRSELTPCEGAGRDEHARRHHDRARRVVDGGTYDDVLTAVHELAHPTCEKSGPECFENRYARVPMELAALAGITPSVALGGVAS